MADVVRDVTIKIRTQVEQATAVNRLTDLQIASIGRLKMAQAQQHQETLQNIRRVEQAQIESLRRIEAAFMQHLARMRAAAGGGGAGGGGGGGGRGFIGGGAPRGLPAPGGGGGGLIVGGGPRIIEVEAFAREVKTATETVRQATKAAVPGKGFFGGGMENKFLSIASATITAFNAPRVVLGGVSEIIRDIAGGGQESFVKPGKEFYGALNEALPRGGMGEMGLKAMGPAGLALMQMVRTVGEEETRLAEQQKATPIAREERFRQSQQMRLDGERQLNQIILERTKVERELIEDTRERIAAAKEEFGLMDVREKQATLDIAKKIAGPGGAGQLTSEELKFARGNVAFRGILSEQAKAGADAAGFAEVVRLLGLDKKIAEAEAKISAEVKQTINVNLDPTDIAKSLEDRLAPLIKELEDITINRIRAEMNARQNEAAALRKAGVAS